VLFALLAVWLVAPIGHHKPDKRGCGRRQRRASFQPAAAALESLMGQKFVVEMPKFALVASFLFIFFGAFANNEG
jgi:hypothetical protein